MVVLWLSRAWIFFVFPNWLCFRGEHEARSQDDCIDVQPTYILEPPAVAMAWTLKKLFHSSHLQTRTSQQSANMNICTTIPHPCRVCLVYSINTSSSLPISSCKIMAWRSFRCNLVAKLPVKTSAHRNWSVLLPTERQQFYYHRPNIKVELFSL